jgi:alpha-galactosidase
MNPIRFDAGDTSLILACEHGAPPRILHWGRRLSSSLSGEGLAALTVRQAGPGVADIPIEASLALEPGLGLLGPSGFSAHRAGKDWGSLFLVRDEARDATGVTISCRDDRTSLSLVYRINIDPETGVVSISSTLTNEGDAPLDLIDMATACLPIPPHMGELIGFSGRWSGEFQRERIARFSGGYIRENRRGRTSHDSFPAIILCNASTNEAQGEAYGLTLGWSGNHRIRVDTLFDGRVFASLGALLYPGEIILAPGERFESPDIIAAYSAHGLTRMSQLFHTHIRSHILRPSTRAKPRPVHYNTWEAVYFDLDLGRLKELASRAAAIGVERFVLDDGWFGSRRSDKAGLGDWVVSDAVYPQGLKPLIDHVTGLGMEMGLWFEPEMVNPDSDLFRAHPDWVLGIEGIAQTPFRNQYVLDISRAEVADYLFARIDAILSDHDISYIKWDMNRDLNHPGDDAGRTRAHAQIQALWLLIDRIRTAHPGVEIESCASGGARPDLGILAHTDRIWTSDTNDAIDRQAIQRGASYFLPLDVLGAHVGPRHCHITGRTLSMAMRAGTAMFGHMGLELNLLSEPEAELAELKAAIALHKRHRTLIHNGNFVRIDTPDYLNVVGVMAADKSEVLYSLAFLKGDTTTLPPRLRFAGLDRAHDYCVRLVWPIDWRSPGTPPTPGLTSEGTTVSGEALMHIGLQLPISRPEEVLIFHVEKSE